MPRSGAGRPRQGRGSFTSPVERRLIPGRAYDLLGVGHLAVSPEGVLLYANPGLAAMLGYDTLDDLALDCEGRVVALWEELGDWEAFASLLATRGGLAQYPAVLRRRGGSFLPCAAWGRLIDWPGVEGRVVEAVFQSEAETHQAFTALTQVLRLHRDMMDLNPDPVLIHQSGLVLLANPAAEAFFGSPGRGSLVGLATEELFEPRSAAWLSRRVRDASRGQPQAGECRLVLANGEEHWVRGFNAAVTFHNRPATLTLLHERTERHRAEAALTEAEFLYRCIAEYSPDPIVIHRDGRLLYANPAAVSFVSSSGPEGLVGRELQDLFHAQSHPLLAGRLREIASSTGVTESEYTVLLGSGGERHIFARSVLVEYQGRTAILSMLQDRTVRRVAEQAKAEAESLYNIIVETAPDPVFIYEPGRLLFANRATARFFRVPSVSALWICPWRSCSTRSPWPESCPGPMPYWPEIRATSS